MYSLKVTGDCEEDRHGTTVTFLPDKEIFEETVYDCRYIETAASGDGFPYKRTEDRSEG